MKQELIERVNNLRASLEQSANNHNALIGRHAEAQYLLDEIMKKEHAELEKQKEAESNVQLDNINPE